MEIRFHRKVDIKHMLAIICFELIMVNLIYRSITYQSLVFLIFKGYSPLLEEIIIPSIFRAIFFSLIIISYISKQFAGFEFTHARISRVNMLIFLLLGLFIGQLLLPPMPIGFIFGLILGTIYVNNMLSKNTYNIKVKLSSIIYGKNTLVFLMAVIASAIIFFAILYFRSLIRINLTDNIQLYAIDNMKDLINNNPDKNYILIVFDVFSAFIKSVLFFLVIGFANIAWNKVGKNPSDNKAFTLSGRA